MKYFVFIDTDFCRDAAELVKLIAEVDPEAQFCGVYGGTPNVLQTFLGDLPPEFPIVKNIHSIELLERSWMNDGDSSALKSHEEYFGVRSINECIIADKYVGHGYISTGYPFEAPLADMCRTLDDQRKYISGMCSFVREYFAAENPDKVFFYAVANAFSVACAQVAGKEGIGFYYPIAARIRDLLTLSTDHSGSVQHIKQTYVDMLNDISGHEDAVRDAHEYIDEFVKKPEMPKHQTFADDTIYGKLTKFQLLILLAQAAWPLYKNKSLQMLYPFTRFVTHFRDSFNRRYLKKRGIFKKVGDIPDGQYALFPLHHDPEASTMVWSPMFTDQLAAIEAISKSIPLTWTLAVKEHRSTWGKRPLSFYKRLLRIPKVVLIHPMEDQYALIKKARLVTGIHGTTAFEAMLLGIVPLLIGHPSYFDVGEGFVHCSDFQRLPEAVQEALNARPASREKLARYVAAILENSFPCHPKLFAETWCSPDEHQAKRLSIARLARVLSGRYSYRQAAAMQEE